MNFSEAVDAARNSQAALEDSLGRLTERQAREPSLLPGWTRGHVVTHLARNADALNRFAGGVITGELETEMYPGGPKARAAAIEEGADRPAELLTADATFAGRRVVETLGAVPAELLDTPVAWKRPVEARFLPQLRWRELEIHHVDLGLEYTAADWPAEFVEATLAVELPALAALEPRVVVPAELARHELLAWLIGRPTTAGLPELPSWPF
ncbi:maleylpyruvate isomerase N-terminal domain-containing protein [Tomitella biformata]|uniref:maleylpyruvate isomerase N-terminal domain-containing protein n=1 Tax=Tomitella biformata TaxID=630403 RepID=UPI000467077C|nr:maleylpyruvate isomerase N-terminal domain-containing protein [Tomitella biformata]